MSSARRLDRSKVDCVTCPVSRFFGQVGGHVTPRQQVQPACVMPRHCALAITDHLARILALPSASPDFRVGRWYQLRGQRTPRNFAPALDSENQAQRKSWINIAVWAVLPRVQSSRPSRDQAKWINSSRSKCVICTGGPPLSD